MNVHKEKNILSLAENNAGLLIIISLGFALLLQTGCSSGGARITFENEILDFGKIRPGSNNTGEFKFTNTGNETLKITNVERCCSVVTKLDKAEYEPGQSGILGITYTAANIPILYEKQVHVNSNDKKNPRVPLTVKAEIVMNVSWEPKTFTLYPDMENAGCPKITIKSVDGTKKFSIKRFISTFNCINADIDPSAQATEFTIQPKVDISKLAQDTRGIVDISLVYAEENEPPDTISIQFKATERFSVTPRPLIMFYSDPQKPISQQLKITKNYGEDFEIENVSSKAGHVKMLGQKEIENGYQFDLEINPEPVDEQRSFNDTLIIAIKDGQKIEISCRGYYSVPDEDQK